MARVLSLLGKGGVGRSTLTLAMARTEARRGRRVLVVSLEPVSAVGLLLDTRLSPEPIEVEPQLSVVHFSTTALIERNWNRLRSAEEEYSRIPLFREVYGQELGVLPGLDQLLVMSSLRDYDLSGQYDLIFFDGGAALDQLRMFAVPEQLSWYIRRFGEAFARSAIGQVLSPFIEPITRAILTVNFSTESVRATTGRFSDILNEGKAVMQNPERLLLYLVSTADPLAIATTRQLWGISQLLGFNVGGALVRGDADWKEAFAPLPVRAIPEAAIADLPAALEGLATVDGAAFPKPLQIDERARTVRIFLPGLTKKQVELNQYGPELTLRAADQRRNVDLPASFRGLRASGAKFQDHYLTVTFG
ncbi:ArsA family ATPase [Gloeobacter kilaueensis]|uniref:Arsenite-activated ATPase ArsA n=1 Tax=Gloeobacter kilaueensis (strain ATCC BAA-2537 / CCAP 1431/1 / ULC 316 / JS1) TaxID=1183438 RepID=U5QQ05_GLOK1|nr:ArsA family ATPase [Gloeobacter kilaueensis]AGY59775.1 arsenite-activated ATPase ArsA [Gloeobacter kilaueensis JS1]